MIRRLLLAILFLSSGAYAQDSLSAGEQILHDIHRALGDAVRFGSAPAHFSGGEWLTAGILAGGTAMLLAADHSMRVYALDHQSETGNDVADAVVKYGEAKYGLALSAGLYTGGLFAHKEGLRETGILLLESIAFAGVTTTVIKSIAGRARPYLGKGNLNFRPFQLDNDYLSFPSGHSTVAFSVSSVLAERIGNAAATVALYSVAGLTAASRVYNDEHWLSDITAGAIIGTVSGLAVCRYHLQDGDGVSVRVTPYPGGIAASVIF